MQGNHTRFHGNLNILDVLPVAALKSVSQTENSRKYIDSSFMDRLKLTVGHMLLRRGRFAMIAGNMSDNFNFSRRKTAKFAIKDDILTVFVMGRDRNKRPDIMEKGGTFEKFPIVCFKMMKRGKSVEELQGETGHML